jgi:GNAT superfamily N-acetyltransferase
MDTLSPTPSLTVYENPHDFDRDVRAHLEAHEAENGLLLGFLSHLTKNPSAEPAFLARLHRGDETVGVAELTGANLMVSRNAHLAAGALVRALRDRGLDMPGLVGPKDAVEPIAAAWTQARACTVGPTVEQMLYELRAVDWPTGVSGRMRAMTPDDVDLVASWLWGFHLEALPGDPYSEALAREHAAQRPAQGFTYLWEVDGAPVAMAALSRPTRHGISVNAVYTPQAHRRHGYASALVAAVSAEGLLRGKAFCVLYTDLANPTANAIYQAIGYRPISRSTWMRFQYAQPGPEAAG